MYDFNNSKLPKTLEHSLDEFLCYLSSIFSHFSTFESNNYNNFFENDSLSENIYQIIYDYCEKHKLTGYHYTLGFYEDFTQNSILCLPLDEIMDITINNIQQYCPEIELSLFNENKMIRQYRPDNGICFSLIQYTDYTDIVEQDFIDFYLIMVEKF